MKSILTFILLITGCGLAWTQSNSNLAPLGSVSEAETNEVPGAAEDHPGAQQPEAPADTVIETHIYSDTLEVGIKQRSATYQGNVRVEDPRIQITCEYLIADVPEGGARVEQVIAETNVVITLIDEKGLTNRAYADRAVYTYQVTDSGTNEVVELSGETEPHIERPDGDLYGNPIIWDRTRNTLRATNQRMTYRGNPDGITNSLLPKAVRPANERLKLEALESSAAGAAARQTDGPGEP